MTVATFQKVKIKDHCEITSSKRIFADEYLLSGVPFYRGKEISEKQRSSSEINDPIYISREKYEEIKSKYGVPQKGDLLLTSVGTIGNPYLVKENEEFYFKDGNLTWFRNYRGINGQWLYYWLLSPQGVKCNPKLTPYGQYCNRILTLGKQFSRRKQNGCRVKIALQ